MHDYTEKVMDHFMNPRNVGTMENPDGTGNAGNARCGDVMQLQIKVENNKITDCKFKTMGCAAAIATSSVLTELIKDKTLEEALQVSNETVVNALGGLPNIKLHCSVLAETTLKAAIADYKNKQKNKQKR